MTRGYFDRGFLDELDPREDDPTNPREFFYMGAKSLGKGPSDKKKRNG
jgi:hypothetical protein